MRIRNTKLQAITLTLAAFLSGSCATFLVTACNAEDFVKIFSFDVDKQYVYHGKKEEPSETISFHDVKIESLVCMPLSDWTAVRARLSTCH
jgi:hypothetical protein